MHNLYVDPVHPVVGYVIPHPEGQIRLRLHYEGKALQPGLLPVVEVPQAFYAVVPAVLTGVFSVAGQVPEVTRAAQRPQSIARLHVVLKSSFANIEDEAILESVAIGGLQAKLQVWEMGDRTAGKQIYFKVSIPDLCRPDITKAAHAVSHLDIRICAGQISDRAGRRLHTIVLHGCPNIKGFTRFRLCVAVSSGGIIN